MNTQEKIEAAGKKKEEGNALFKAAKYERASKRYEKVFLCTGLQEMISSCLSTIVIHIKSQNSHFGDRL